MSSKSASEWYYLDHQQRQCGPVTALALVRGFHAASLGLDTLIWRDGLSPQPLRQQLSELGLPEALADAPSSLLGAPPPPRPDRPRAMPSTAATFDLTAHTPTVQSAPTRSNRTGIWILVTVASLLGMVFVVAIAMLAYRGYSLRTKTTSAITIAAPFKTRVEAYYHRHQRCPANGSKGFPAQNHRMGSVANITVGRFDNGHCGFELTLDRLGSDKLDGKFIWFDYDSDNGQWTCSSEIENRYLPMECRTN